METPENKTPEINFDLPKVEENKTPENNVQLNSEQSAWNLAQRKATALSKSDLIPVQYKNNVANCLLAMELANRTGMNELMVMQNLHIIQGKPSWSSTFAIAVINSSKRFKTMLNFQIEGAGNDLSCIAWAIGNDGQRYESPKITISMARAEGWLDKKDKMGKLVSKWLTMPELMIRYRAAAFFGRLFCSELLLGMQTEDEIIDITPMQIIKEDEFNVDELRKKYNQIEELIPAEIRIHIERILDNQEKLNYKKVSDIINQFNSNSNEQN